jgi:soluble P-type ATPase
MIEVVIPGFRRLRLEHLVMDYNGTLAVDGQLLPEIRPRLDQLARQVRLHVVTADTFETVREQLQGLDCALFILKGEKQSNAKLSYLQKLGTWRVVAIGNGRNDQRMLRAAALGIAVMQREGLAVDASLAADLLVADILTGLDLLLYPQRLIASLRS